MILRLQTDMLYTPCGYTCSTHEVEQEGYVPLYPISPYFGKKSGGVLVTRRRNQCLLFGFQPAVNLYSTIGLLQAANCRQMNHCITRDVASIATNISYRRLLYPVETEMPKITHLDPCDDSIMAMMLGRAPMTSNSRKWSGR